MIRIVKGTIKVMGIIVSLLSVVWLVVSGYNLGVGVPLKKMLDWYLWFIDNTIGQARPAAEWLLQSINRWLHLNLHLLKHWTYFFAPMMLYFASDAWAMSQYSHRIGNAVFATIWGLIVATFTSIAIGTVSLDAPGMPIVIYPAIGFVVYVFVQCIWDVTIRSDTVTSRRLRFRDLMVAYPFANLLMLWMVMYIGDSASKAGYLIPGVIQVLIFVVFMSFRNLLIAAVGATVDKSTGPSWRRRFLGYGACVHGIRVLGVLIGAFVTVVLGAASGP